MEKISPLKTPTQCPACFTADVIQDSRDLPYSYKDMHTMVYGVTGKFCPACGELILDKKESARVSAAMLAFNKQVDAGVICPTKNHLPTS